MHNPFADAVLSGQLIIAIPIAVLAGLVSFASPCVLPLIPGYFSYLTGMVDPRSTRNTSRLVVGVVLFILGFSVIFVAESALFGVIGSWLLRWNDLISRILGGVVVLLGIIFVGWFSFFQRSFKPSWKPASGLVGAPLLGIVFGLGWTPCIGPTLAAIQALSIASASASSGIILGVFYCFGLGLPFLFLAFGFTWMTRSVTFFKKHIRAINVFGGLGLILIGLLMISGFWSFFTLRLQEVIPAFVPAI